ncbi:PREDICTED: uncharacterized protein LOC106810212, partial [Priapulus caudatus]|uniref:Uncharacterized protein LOC106810212 n=1 Tax=Priapulus caudatus TaxID=37621 RepID=A0ABM1E9W0_PRICU
MTISARTCHWYMYFAAFRAGQSAADCEINIMAEESGAGSASGETATGFRSLLSFSNISNMFLILWCLASTVIIILYVVLPRVLRRKQDDPVDAQKSAAKETNADQEKNDCSKWINEVASWLYHNYKRNPDLAANWLKSLNGCAKQEPSDGVQVQFDRLQKVATPPKFSDVHLKTENGNLITECTVDAQNIAFVVFAKEETESGLKTSNFDVRVQKLQGKAQFHVTQQQGDLHLTACFLKSPDVTLSSNVQTKQHPNDQSTDPRWRRWWRGCIGSPDQRTKLSSSELSSRPHRSRCRSHHHADPSPPECR